MLLEEHFGVAPEVSADRLTKIGQRIPGGARPWQRYHAGDFEALLEDPARTIVIECKSRVKYGLTSWGADGTDDVAADVFAQVQGQMEAVRADRDHWVGSSLPDLNVTHVAVRVDGRDIRHFLIERDEEIGAMLVERAERFWRDHVLTETPPPPDGSEGADRELSDRFRAYTERMRAPVPVEVDLLKRIRSVQLTIDEIRAELAPFEAEELQLRQQLQQQIGHDLGVEIPGDCKATWKHSQGRLDREALVKELAARLGLSSAQRKEAEDRHRADPRRKLSVIFE
jgi:predicted phage-related endonuclease